MEKTANKISTLSEYPLVQAGDCDFTQQLNLTALQRRMQEIAYTHAAKLGLDSDSLCSVHTHWVLGRMSIYIAGELPKWKDSYEVRTWISGYDRLFAFRDFQFLQGGKVFGTAATTWLLIDAGTRKPVSPAEAFACKDLDYPLLEDRIPSKRLRAADGGKAFDPYTVGYRDVDLHNHVNNTRYLAYFLDTFSRSHFLENRCREFHINFQQEIQWGDRIQTTLASGEDGRYHHRIDKQGNALCALGESLWEPYTN